MGISEIQDNTLGQFLRKIMIVYELSNKNELLKCINITFKLLQ